MLIFDHHFLGIQNPKSYWQYALKVCDLDQEERVPSQYRCIDHYWRNIVELKDDEGALKYPQLYMLAWCILSLSHGNAVPEHGFSINRKILDAHGYSISKETIIALRIGKSCLSYQDFYGSRTIGPRENCPPTPKLTLTQTLSLTRQQFSSGAIAWLPPQTLKLILTLAKTPTLTQGHFSSGSNCPVTNFYIIL